MTQKAFAVEIGLEVVDDAGQTQYLRGLVDPSQAPGVPAPISSQYNRQSNNPNEVAVYLKFGPADTDWRLQDDPSSSGTIGTAEDGDYTDGLFTDFTPTTPVGTAVDRFNEVLAALAPPPAPSLDAIGAMSTGVSAKLSFGATNTIAGYSNVAGPGPAGVKDINDTMTVTGNSRGIFGSGTTSFTGVLNSGKPAHSNGAYPANAFGDGNLGVLQLEVNGVVVHTADLTTFGAGNNLNANGSGFNLSAATPVEFASGTPFDQFQYRTGTFVINAADFRNGYNYVRVIHDRGGNQSITTYGDFVYDPNATAMVASGGVLDNLVMSGSKYLSGVQYHTAGSAQYDVVIDNAHRNVYPTGNAISFTVVNGSAASQAFANIATEADSVTITNKAVTVTNSGRLLNAPLTVGVNVTHPLKSNLSNQQSQTISGLLLDNVASNSTAINESFNDEAFRLPNAATANNYAAQADVTSATWNSTALVSAAGDAAHQNNLLVYNGALQFATQGIDAGDFRNVADGNANGPANGPTGNPNYSAETGTKVYYRRFVNNTGSTRANFRLRFLGASTTFAAVGGAVGNAITVEMKFPNGAISTATGWMDAYGDFATAQWTDGDGCRNATAGAGRALSTDWGITVGTLSIASGESVVIRITASDGWTGYLSDIQLTWL